MPTIPNALIPAAPRMPQVLNGLHEFQPVPRYNATGTEKPSKHHYVRAILILMFLSVVFSLADSAASNPYSQTNIELTEASNGSTIAIVVGTNLNIYLKVLPEDIYKSTCYWSTITISDASVLQQVHKAVLLPTGVTAAFFKAVRPGLVQLNSFRHNCSDGGVILWHVKLRVTY
jgi:hypothetical protein